MRSFAHTPGARRMRAGIVARVGCITLLGLLDGDRDALALVACVGASLACVIGWWWSGRHDPEDS